MAIMLFYFLQKCILMNVAYFLKVYQPHTISGSYIKMYQFCSHLSSLFVHYIVRFLTDDRKLKNNDIGIAFSSMTFIPNFMKTGQMVQKVKARACARTHTQHNDLISVLFFSLRKVNELKKIPRSQEYSMNIKPKKGETMHVCRYKEEVDLITSTSLL